MTFEEWWEEQMQFLYAKEVAQGAWEAGIQEGVDRMYRLYDICPECKLTNGQHKMDCGRGR